MKKLLLLVFLCSIQAISLYAQVPNKFNYQGILRNTSGELIANTKVAIQISLLEGSSTATASYIETHTVTTNAYGQFAITIGDGIPTSGSLSSIDWASGVVYLKTEVDENGETSFKELGTVQLITVPYAIHSNSAENLGDKNIYAAGSDTLFVVKDHSGNVVFAVFPDGAAVYVNEQAKGKVGGFAVSGRSPSKATEYDVLRITPDSSRIYVNQTAVKGKVGGFAVSGRSPSKLGEEEYLVVTSDSTRIYINQSATKGKVGGFAVSGRSPSKSTVSNFLDITPENYFIGHESGQKTLNSPDFGIYNVFLGYQTGMENLTGLENVFIGYKTAQANTHGTSNVYIGSESGFSNTLGADNVYIGSRTGYNNSEGINNVFLGSRSGFNNLDGDDNVFVGFETGFSNTTGIRNTFIGNKAGYANTIGNDNIFIGELAGYESIGGNENIFIGKRAGHMALNSEENTYIGSYSGQQTTTGTGNTFLGHRTGLGNTEGSQNTYLGALAANRDSLGSSNVAVGFNAGGWGSGSNNVYVGVAAGMNHEGDSSIFIGFDAGSNATGSQKLYIENSSLPNPLIYGEFDNDQLVVNGSINYGSASGTDDYAVQINSIGKYIEGMALYVKFPSNNSSGATIKVNDLPSKSLIKPGGSELIANDLKAGGIYLLIYDGTNFQLMTQ